MVCKMCNNTLMIEFNKKAVATSIFSSYSSCKGNTGCSRTTLLLPNNKITDENIIINPSITDLKLIEKSDTLDFTINNNLFLFALSNGGSYKLTKDICVFFLLATHSAAEPTTETRKKLVFQLWS